MSAIKQALLAELFKWADPDRSTNEAAETQIDAFLKTPLGKRIESSLKFESALRNIENPIGHMQEEAERDGYQINGGMLISLAKDPGYLQGIAKDALKGIPKVEVL